jgi:hypothetical protein
MRADRFKPVIVRWGHISHEVSIRLAIAAVNTGSRGSCTFRSVTGVTVVGVRGHLVERTSVADSRRSP